MIILKPNSSTSEVYAALLIKRFVKKGEQIVVREATKTELSIGGVPTVGFNSKPYRWNFRDTKIKAYNMALYHLKLRGHITTSLSKALKDWLFEEVKNSHNLKWKIRVTRQGNIYTLEDRLNKFIKAWTTNF